MLGPLFFSQAHGTALKRLCEGEANATIACGDQVINVPCWIMEPYWKTSAEHQLFGPISDISLASSRPRRTTRDLPRSVPPRRLKSSTRPFM